jgi:Lon protease-like protein
VTKTALALEAALGELPLFPLAQVVLFPRALLPLHVFEPRYRTMLKDCLASHRVMAIVHVPDPADFGEDGQPRISHVAGVGVIVEHQGLADGRSNILLHGQGRVRLEELPYVPPYRRARATLLEDVHSPIPETDRAALVASATAFGAEVSRRDPKFSFHLPSSLEPAAIADLCAHHLIIDSAARQAILEELDVVQRVRMVIAELAAQHGALSGREGGGALN